MKTKIDPDAIYEAVVSFAGAGADGGVLSVRQGSRWRGDSPVVKRAPWAFLPDGSGEEAALKRRLELQAEAERPIQRPPDPTATEVPRPVPVRDRVLCIKGCGLIGGEKTVSREPLGCRIGDIISRKTRLYRENKACFVDVAPTGLAREDAVVAQVELSHGDRKVFAGQWIHRNDPLVQMQHSHFLPAPLD